MRKLEQVALGLAGGSATAALAYAFLRVAERALLPEANPAILIGVERSAFAFRALSALYFGGFGAFGFAALALARPLVAARLLRAAVGLAAVALVAQAALAP